MIRLKSEKEIEIISENCRILAEILAELENQAREGTSTKELNDLAEELIRKTQAEPAFLGYRGFPAAICTSLNEEIVHGIPSSKRILKGGDILKIDIGIKRRGFYADKATTVAVGQISAEAQRLLAVTQQALKLGIEAAQPGNRVSDISSAIGSYVLASGFFVVKRFVGHGIGREMHEEPQVPNYWSPGQERGPILRPGMVLAIEPMVKTEEEEKISEDGFTVVTANGGLAAHFEEMVLITSKGPQVLP